MRAMAWNKTRTIGKETEEGCSIQKKRTRLRRGLEELEGGSLERQREREKERER